MHVNTAARAALHPDSVHSSTGRLPAHGLICAIDERHRSTWALVHTLDNCAVPRQQQFW